MEGEFNFFRKRCPIFGWQQGRNAHTSYKRWHTLRGREAANRATMYISRGWKNNMNIIPRIMLRSIFCCCCCCRCYHSIVWGDITLDRYNIFIQWLFAVWFRYMKKKQKKKVYTYTQIRELYGSEFSCIMWKERLWRHGDVIKHVDMNRNQCGPLKEERRGEREVECRMDTKDATTNSFSLFCLFIQFWAFPWCWQSNPYISTYSYHIRNVV